MSKSRNYTGRAIKVSFDPRRCIHAAECVRGLPSVFDPKRKPWIEPDAAAADSIAAVVQKCPTGALHYEMTESGQRENAPASNTVGIVSDGPLYVCGEIKVVDSAGAEIAHDTRVALCRCGESRNKPFCDGRHRDVDFKDPGLVAETLDQSGEDPNGDLEIRPIADGPLLCGGRFEIVDGTGAIVATSGTATLCRCGQSDKKPFCDGTHSRVGFRA